MTLDLLLVQGLTTFGKFCYVFRNLKIGNVMGNPGVFRGNPHPFPSKPVPAHTGAGFDGNGSRVEQNPREANPIQACDKG